MNKKLLLSIAIVFTIFTTTGCTKKETPVVSHIENSSEVNMSWYSYLKNNENFKGISKDTLINSIGDSSVNAIIYMGYSDCENCQRAISDIQKAAVENNQTVYYFDTEEEIKTDKDYDLLLNTLKSILTSMDENNPDDIKLFTPHVFFIKGGELLPGYVGYANGYDYNKLFKENGF